MEENEKRSLIGSILRIFIPIAIVAAAVILIINIKPEEEVEEDLYVNSFASEEKNFTLENDELKFTLDAATTQFEVEVKETGAKWFSNPKDADKDEIALTADKNNLNSTLMLTYGTMNGVWTTINNYKLSIEKGIYEIYAEDDWIRVDYTVGDIEPRYIIPLAVPEDRFNEFVDEMTKKQKKEVLEYYRKYDINKLKSTDDKDELLAKYYDLEETKIYVLRDNVKPYLKAKIEGFFNEVGYTEEDYESDLARYEQTSSQDIPIFNVSILYELDGKDLRVSVPYEMIEYRKDYPIVNVDVLPYFGAGNISDDGFMVVPESGGCLINFNNGRYNQEAYYTNVYGWDYCTNRTSVVTETRSAFPMFAMCNNGTSFLCCIEDGAGFSNIRADVSGRLHNFNHAGAGYSILHYESYDVGDKSSASFFVFEDKIPAVTASQIYRFVDTDSYVELAHAYGDYLTEKYPELDREADSETPIVVDVINAVDKVQQKFGVPQSAPYALTTYSETTDIVNQLTDAGITGFDLRLNGWMNDGYTHTVLTDVDLISELGGKSRFKTMLSDMKSKGIDVYLDGQTDFAYNSGMTDGFIAFRDSARFTTRENAELYNYSIVWYGQDEEKDPYYLLKPQYSTECINELADFAKEYDTYISYRNIGHLLSSDFNPKNLFTREDVILRQRQDLQNVKDSGIGRMILNYGNDYVLEYADVITDMDISNTNAAIIDFDIPFYQIAIHDKVNYTGDALNMSEDSEYELLKSAEYGAGLNFEVMAAKASKLQDTNYTCFYGADFSRWKDRIIEIAKKYNEDFNGLFGETITGHYLAGNKVRVTEYGNGTKVYVNYGYEDETVDGVKVPSRQYIVK